MSQNQRTRNRETDVRQTFFLLSAYSGRLGLCRKDKRRFLPFTGTSRVLRVKSGMVAPLTLTCIAANRYAFIH